MIDVSSNRAARKWSRRELAVRVLWRLITPLFRFSPRPFWGWRRTILRLFGASVGINVHIYPSVRVTIPWNIKLGDHCAIGDRVIVYALGPITIGSCTTISQGVHLCAGSHEWRDPAMPLTKPPILIGKSVWICADAFIGPNVKIGDNAIIGARSVAMKDVDDACIMIGNPARKVGVRMKDDHSLHIIKERIEP